MSQGSTSAHPERNGARGRAFKFRWEDALLNDQKLTAMQKLVGMALATHANGDGGNAHPSIATLTRRTSMSKRSVQAALKTLRQHGWIDDVTPPERKEAQCYGWSTVYALAIPPGAAHDKGGAGGAPGVGQEVHPKRPSRRDHKEDSVSHETAPRFRAGHSSQPDGLDEDGLPTDEALEWIEDRIGGFEAGEEPEAWEMLERGYSPAKTANIIGHQRAA